MDARPPRRRRVPRYRRSSLALSWVLIADQGTTWQQIPFAGRRACPRSAVPRTPRGSTRPIPAVVPPPYKDDFAEACMVLNDSPKASAALSRRCLQAILRDIAKTKSKNLADQIDEVIGSGSVPPHIQGELDAIWRGKTPARASVGTLRAVGPFEGSL